MGIVRFIGSGRVQVDFNHKYAGRTLIYDANIVKKIESDDEKITNLVRRRLPIDQADMHYEIKDSELEISIPEKIFLLDGLQIIKRGIVGDIFKFVPAFKNIVFVEKYSNSSAINTSENSDTEGAAPEINNSSNLEDSSQGKQQNNADDDDDDNKSNASLNADNESKKTSK